MRHPCLLTPCDSSNHIKYDTSRLLPQHSYPPHPCSCADKKGEMRFLMPICQHYTTFHHRHREINILFYTSVSFSLFIPLGKQAHVSVDSALRIIDPHFHTGWETIKAIAPPPCHLSPSPAQRLAPPRPAVYPPLW